VHNLVAWHEHAVQPAAARGRTRAAAADG
jgi:hypothetical protein